MTLRSGPSANRTAASRAPGLICCRVRGAVVSAGEGPAVHGNPGGGGEGVWNGGLTDQTLLSSIGIGLERGFFFFF